MSVTKTALLTVGSTEFTSLVLAALSEEVLQALARAGYDAFIVQYGKSILTAQDVAMQTKRLGVQVELHAFMDDIEERMRGAGLVICHAGAGSILAALRGPALNPLPPSTKKQLIVVANDTLMDSHQSDLADELRARGWAKVADSPNPKDLADAVKQSAAAPVTTLSSSQAFPEFEGKRIRSILDEQMGFT